MSNSPLTTIIAREYLERVKRKSFIISTLLMPIFMVLLMALPALIAVFATPEEKVIAVIDDSAVIAPSLQSNDEMRFVEVAPDSKIDALTDGDDYQAVLVIGADVIDNPSNVSFYSREASSMMIENAIASQIKDAVEAIRLKRYNIDNLSEILAQINADVEIQTYRVDRSEASETSSALSYGIGLIMSFMLYMFILLYGQMVMTSIIEEKNNRVLELVVSSVKPTYLMLGKIVGIGLVAITQILIWVVIVMAFTTWGLPSMLASLASDGDAGLSGLMTQLGDTSYVLSLCVFLLLFLIGGYLFYSSIYAAIGSAVDNIQDASQLQTIAILPIVVGMVLSPAIINDPTSTFAVWVSIIPFTSPMTMMARIPFGIPVWQIVLSLVLLYLTFLALVWIAAKIYRVGIFMYGKKPTFAELIRWATYK